MSAEVRGLSVNQPWATLVALGVKQWETRPMALPSTITPDVDVLLCSTVKRPDIAWEGGEWATAQVGDDWMIYRRMLGDGPVLPLGAVVAVVRFSESLPIGENGDNFEVRRIDLDLYCGTAWAAEAGEAGMTIMGSKEITDQLPYGDFTPGRWAWRVADVRPLTEPVSVIGDGVHHQGFWRPSAATVAAVREQVGE